MSKTLKTRKYYELSNTLPSWKWQVRKPIEVIKASVTFYALHPKGKVLLLGTQPFCPISRDGVLLTLEMKNAVKGWEAERLLMYHSVGNPKAVQEHLQRESDKVWNKPFNLTCTVL